MASAGMDKRMRGMTHQSHPRLDRGSMPSAAMDTRMRGYDEEWRV
jgi:hypothetical protein